MLDFLVVFIGGGLGSCCRYLVSLLITSTDYPLGTLLANVIACFLLGYLTGYSVKNTLDGHTKLFFSTGFCGGFSTFSTFSKELFNMSQDALTLSALSYILLSLLLGIVAVYVGFFLGNSKP
jgi:CrcB protein